MKEKVGGSEKEKKKEGGIKRPNTQNRRILKSKDATIDMRLDVLIVIHRRGSLFAHVVELRIVIVCRRSEEAVF